MEASVEKKSIFNRYDVFVITILSLLQFTVILDFMVLSPLGAILIPELKITTSQFGMVVSAYAFSAGISGIMAAGFADRFDRKAFLLFFYAGFMIGTTLCALATTYEFLLIARIVTGIFGGVIGSVGFAIVTDLFKFEVRGRVMGFMQMSFAASQVLGLPIGLLLANRFDWHAPFWMLVILGLVLGAIICDLDEASNRTPCTQSGQTSLSSPGFYADRAYLCQGVFVHHPPGYGRIYDDAFRQCLWNKQPGFETR